MANIPIPYTFIAGTIIDPDQMNANFQAVSTGAASEVGGDLNSPIITTPVINGPSTISGTTTFSGDLLFNPDATYDIGKSLATRPRDGFFSRNLTGGGLLAMTGFGTHILNASGTGSQSLQLANTASGLTMRTMIDMSAGSTGLQLYVFSQGYNNQSIWDLSSGAAISAPGSGGLSIVSGFGAIRFYTGSTIAHRWTIGVNGYLLPAATTVYDVGSDTARAGNIFGYSLNLNAGTPIIVENIGVTAGTPVHWVAGGYFYKQSSSRRYKEHLAPVLVAADDLDRFMALTPQRWDYIGQPTGAFGFVAEDLTDILPNADGRSALLNYDAEGLPESNRDFALIGLQHLVIQDLWRRVAALEGRR